MSRKGENNKKTKGMLRQQVERRERAALRKAESDKRTPEEQLSRLDKAGLAAVKERLKLSMEIKGM